MSGLVTVRIGNVSVRHAALNRWTTTDRRLFIYLFLTHLLVNALGVKSNS